MFVINTKAAFQLDPLFQDIKCENDLKQMN